MIKRILPLALLLTCMNTFAADLPTTKEDLLSRFLAAHEANSFEQISALINWDGVRKYKKKMIHLYTKNTFSRKIKGTEFEAADTEFLKNFSVGPKNYKSNMDVTHLMRIYFEDTNSKDNAEYDSVVYLVGKNNDSYQIAITINDKSGKTTSAH